LKRKELLFLYILFTVRRDHLACVLRLSEPLYFVILWSVAIRFTAFHQIMVYVDVERDMIMDGESMCALFFASIHSRMLRWLINTEPGGGKREAGVVFGDPVGACSRLILCGNEDALEIWGLGNDDEMCEVGKGLVMSYGVMRIAMGQVSGGGVAEGSLEVYTRRVTPLNIIHNCIPSLFLLLFSSDFFKGENFTVASKCQVLGLQQCFMI
jgi:hypothetical protein